MNGNSSKIKTGAKVGKGNSKLFCKSLISLAFYLILLYVISPYFLTSFSYAFEKKHQYI
jgi:hypothetical protein